MPAVPGCFYFRRTSLLEYWGTCALPWFLLDFIHTLEFPPHHCIFQGAAVRTWNSKVYPAFCFDFPHPLIPVPPPWPQWSPLDASLISFFHSFKLLFSFPSSSRKASTRFELDVN
ncbi:hypothetical protein SOMG_04169 [Schizosaccharomyces osmophilus]|uniref:Uncharacterized protein n=1 Tax=Schizosaccharomyces osmophilus TaxID=2545709 RepID=A0AAE9WFI2_9SCHI|nr:uncharacterized protein SOMG_04169 [Schizosaccharomyces osmophilus]WBW74739.1 hypothetical protein SOMG_04169 [Schizosaccharomyces osmophilus]